MMQAVLNLEGVFMAKFDSYEAVDRQAYAGHKILKTRFVDTDEKSRFVAKEYNTGATDEF